MSNSSKDRGRRSVVLSPLAVLGLALAARAAQPGFIFELRVHSTGGKEITVTDPGDAFTLDLYCQVVGSDGDLTNDKMSSAVSRIVSSPGGLLGDLIGLSVPPPFNYLSTGPGIQQDLDGDGDLDIGANVGTNVNDFYRSFSGPSNPIPAGNPGGVLIGQMRFTAVQLGALQTEIQWTQRPNSPIVAFGEIDGVQVGAGSGDPLLQWGAPLIVHAAEVFVPGPTQYLSGNVNTHLTVEDTVKQGVGGPLVLNEGITVHRGGLFDMRDPTGQVGTQEIRVSDAISGNDGGAIFTRTLVIGHSAPGSFTQTRGLTQLGGTLSLGSSSGNSATLTISGGSLRSGPLILGRAANASVQHNGGFVTASSLDMVTPLAGVGSEYNLTGGAFNCNGTGTIGGGAGTALFRVGGSGQANFAGNLYITADNANRGDLQITGGTFGAAFLRIVSGASVTQTGGNAPISSLVIGVGQSDPLARAYYDLIDGVLSPGGAQVGQSNARGTLRQTGGTILGSGVLYVHDEYELHDGTANVQGVYIPAAGNGLAGRVTQSGGFLSTRDLTVYGTYRITGGSFEVTQNLRILGDGTIDFGGSDASLRAGVNSLFEVPTVGFGNNSSASLFGAPGSLINYPASYNPADHFATVQTQGLLHEQGTPLNIPAGKSVTGAGEIQGNVTNAGEVHPGYGAGELDIAGNYTQSASGKLSIEIGGPSSFDLLSITGPASLGGLLEVTMLDGYIPQEFDTFTILRASFRSGQFVNALSQVYTNDGLGRFDVSYAPDGVVLSSYAVVPEPAAAAFIAGLALIGGRRRKAAHPAAGVRR